MTRVTLALLVLVGGVASLVACRDYGLLECADDLAGSADLGPGEDQAVPLDAGTDDAAQPQDLAPSCKLVAYDRDAGPPPNPNIVWDAEQLRVAPVPDGGTGAVGQPSRLSAGDGDGDGYADVVSLVPTNAGNGPQLTYYRGQITSGRADLTPAWTANSTTPVTVHALADFLPDETAATRPRRELVTSFDGQLLASKVNNSTVGVFRVTPTGMSSLMPVLDLADVAALNGATWSRVVQIASGDLDGDGHVDLVLGINHHDGVSGAPYPAGTLLVLWGGTVHPLPAGPPYFDWTTVQATAIDVPMAHPADIVITDLDGDCAPEIAVAGVSMDASGTAVQVVRIGGATPRTLTTTTVGVMPGAFASLNAADVGRRGHRSLVYVASTDFKILDPHDGTYATVSSFDVTTLPLNVVGTVCGPGGQTCAGATNALVSGDFDGDGAEDLFTWAYFQYQTPTAFAGLFYRNDSLGGLVRTPATGTVVRGQTDKNATTASLSVDIDGDRHPEIVFVDNGFKHGINLDRVLP